MCETEYRYHKHSAIRVDTPSHIQWFTCASINASSSFRSHWTVTAKNTVCNNILGCSGLSGGLVGKANEVPQSLECRVGGVRVEVEEEELCN